MQDGGRVRLRAVASTVVGALGSAIGVGVGLPHLSKRGPVVTTALGLAALVLGLVLLVAGTVVLSGTTRGWRRLPPVLGALVVLGTSLLTVGQAVAATQVPPTRLGSARPVDLGLRSEDVEITTGDGVRLSGWYLPSTNGAAVALLHGAGSTRTSVLDQAALLVRAGYGVLLYDARGHGRSEGRAMDFGWFGDRDVAAAVTYLVERPEVDDDRIGVVGLSMGGEEAIGAAASDRRIHAVVAEGATNRVAGDKAWLSDEHGVQGWLQEQLDRVTYGITDLLTSADPPITLRRAVHEAAPTPVLLIAAGEVDTEQQAARFIAAGSPAAVQTWVVPGAGHTGGLDTDPDGWEERVVGFLDEALGR